MSTTSMRNDDMVDVLTSMGVYIHRVSGDEINGRCPVHHMTKGRESTRFSWYLNSETGLWHCHSCGSSGNLPYLVSLLHADPRDVQRINVHILRQGLDRVLAKGQQEDREPAVRCDWTTYASFPSLPPAILKRRRVSEEKAKMFGVRWNPEPKAMVLPIISPQGDLLGWQEKKRGWVNNVPHGVEKGQTFFGIERARTTTALLLESPIDVVRFHTVYTGDEISAIASFGVNMSQDQIELLHDKFDKLILAYDNDNEGHRESKRLVGLVGNRNQRTRRQLSTFRHGIRWWNYDGLDDVKDLGDMTDEQILAGLNKLKIFP